MDYATTLLKRANKLYTDAQDADLIRQQIQDYVQTFSDQVASTLGPWGMNVGISTPEGIAYTKDGVTVARHINPKDPIQAFIAESIKAAAQETVEKQGDGTTTTSILVNAIYQQIADYKGNPHTLIKDLAALSQKIKDYTHKTLSRSVKDHPELLRIVATISANNNTHIGNTIADLVFKTGKGGNISIKKSTYSKTYTEHQEGIVIDSPIITDLYVKEDPELTLRNPLILILDQSIEDIRYLENVLSVWINNSRKKNGKDLVIFASGISGSALSNIYGNAQQLGRRIIAFTNPESNRLYRKKILNDLRIITGAKKIYSITEGTVIEDFDNINEFGTCREMKISKDKVVITQLNDSQQKRKISIANKVLSQLSKEKQDEDPLTYKFNERRYSLLTSGIGTIYVGGQTPTEKQALKDLVDDAVCACLSALRGGVVPGGGKVYWDIAAFLENQEGFASKVLKQAIKAPIYKMYENAGWSKEKIEDHVFLELSKKRWFTRNILTEKSGLADEVGVLDPTHVAIDSLKNAISVAGKFLTTKWILINQK